MEEKIIHAISQSVSRLNLFLSDIDECAAGPCMNGATCSDQLFNYTCTCVIGFTGRNCSTSKFHWCETVCFKKFCLGLGRNF